MNQNDGFIKKFIHSESTSGILLIISAIGAMIIANSPLQLYYLKMLQLPVHFSVGNFEIHKPLLLWVNDGLMSGFFFLIGLELKREFVEGELSNPKNILLPGIGAIGGMVVPALIYVAFNYDNEVALKGWAIPTATDIAFALGALTLLGPRVPTTLKVFLTSLAIFDDVGAIVIIAIFYTSKISMFALGAVAISLALLFICNRMNVTKRSIYIFIGSILWISMLKSGVHATLAGVLLAFFIPIVNKKNPQESPLKNLEHDLHGAVSFLVLPIFAFFNAGVTFNTDSLDQIFNNVSLGIIFGLIIGKTLGIFTSCWIFFKLKILAMPDGFNYKILFGISALCGIGFTMSLFIGGLAFEGNVNEKGFDERIGILLGSFISGIIGFIILKMNLKNDQSGIETDKIKI